MAICMLARLRREPRRSWRGVPDVVACRWPGIAPAQTSDGTQKRAIERRPICLPGPENFMASIDRSLVAHLPLFAGFSAEELTEVLREARSIRAPRNTAVFDQGADATSFFLLLHGHVRASKTT